MSEADKAAPPVSGDYRRDIQSFGQFWPQVPAMDAARAARERFLAAHVEAVYRALTKDLAHFRPRRAVWFMTRRAQCRAWCRRPKRSRAENALEQKAKRGLEIDQGIFLAHVLGDPTPARISATRCCCRGPKRWRGSPNSAPAAGSSSATATIERRGKAAIVILRNPRFLNAEDEHDARRV